MGSVGIIRPAQLHLPPPQIAVPEDPQDDALPDRFDVGVGGNEVRLLLGEAADGGFGVGTGLAEGHLGQVFRHAPGQGAQGGEHHRGQEDRQHRDEVAAPLLLEQPPGQGGDRAETAGHVCHIQHLPVRI